MNKKRILYITESYPFLRDGGGPIKSCNTILTLSKKFDLMVIGFCANQEKISRTNLNQEIKQYFFYLPQIHQTLRKQLIRLLINYCQLTPYLIFQYYDQKCYQKIQQLIEDFNPDSIHIDHLSMSAYLPTEKKQLWIYEEHNIEQNLYKSFIANTSNIKRKIFYFVEYLLIKRYENRTLAKFDHIFAISDLDKKWLRQTIKSNRVSLQNPVLSCQNKKHLEISLKKISATKTNLLFIGNLNWQPNYQAIVWFVKNVFPKITKKHPSIKFNIVGRLPSKLTLPECQGVVYYGYQKKISNYLNQNNIFVLPIKSGGGIRIKALTAIAHGLALVATKEAMEGTIFKNKLDYLLAENETQFVEQICKLIVDQKLKKKLVNSAFEKLKKNHGTKQNDLFLKKYQQLFESTIFGA